MSKVSVSIAVTEAHLDDILDVAETLRQHGMEVHQIMDQIGIITGACEASSVASLKNIAGVESVERAQNFHAAPPHSRIQ